MNGRPPMNDRAPRDAAGPQSSARRYTAELQKTTGAFSEIKELFELWQPGMPRQELSARALAAGALGRSSTTRVNDIVSRAFAQRFLLPDDRAARRIKVALDAGIPDTHFRDLVFHYTLRTVPPVHDFLAERYWPAVWTGQQQINGAEIVNFLRDQAGTQRMPEPWSPSVIARVARNLGKTLTDFGFFEDRRSAQRRIRFRQISDFLLAYALIEGHQDGLGDTALLSALEWDAHGLDWNARIDRIQRLTTTDGPFIFQFAGDLARFSWRYETVEEFLRAQT